MNKKKALQKCISCLKEYPLHADYFEPNYKFITNFSSRCNLCNNSFKYKFRHQKKLFKLNDVKVLEIKKLLSKGESVAKISKTYKISQSTISKIKNGYTWTHVILDEKAPDKL